MAEKTGYSTTEQQATSDGKTRRRFLKGTAAAGVAATGVSAAASPASAQLFGGSGGSGLFGGSGGGGLFGGDSGGGIGGSDPENATAPTFDVGSFGANQLPESNADELVIYLHGAMAGSSAGSQAGEMRERLANAGYQTTVVAGVFSEGDVSIGDAGGAAADHLAGLIEDYKDSTGGAVHIVGYSLGGILTYQTVNSLGSGYTIQTAASLGTGTPDDTFCQGNVYYDGLANNTENVCILISDNDSAVSGMNAGDTGCGGGLFGGGGSAPPNMDVVDVTSTVDSHMTYLDSSQVHQELASCIEQSSGSAGTGGGTTGTGGGTTGTGGETTGTGGETAGTGGFTSGGFTGGSSDGFTSGGFTGGSSGGFTSGGFTGGSSGGFTGGSSGGFTGGSSGGFTGGGSLFGSGSGGGLIGGGGLF